MSLRTTVGDSSAHCGTCPAALKQLPSVQLRKRVSSSSSFRAAWPPEFLRYGDWVGTHEGIYAVIRYNYINYIKFRRLTLY